MALSIVQRIKNLIFKKNWTRGVWILLATLTAAQVGLTPKAEAYDRDTHFYATYIMARHAGFTHEYSSFLATGAQWVDEAVTSTPMGGLILGTTMRRLYHFPAYRLFLPARNHGPAKMTGLTEAEVNHPVAHRLMWKGMINGNWLMAALSLHIIQDTAGHAGFPAELGHAWAGHHPDRPFLEPEKYREMMSLVFQALVSLRRLAPDEALEPAFKKFNKIDVQQTDAEVLAETLWNNQEYREVVLRNVFQTLEYSKQAVEYILATAQERGNLRQSVKLSTILPTEEDYRNLDGSIKEPRQVLNEWVIRHRTQEVAEGHLVAQSIFNLEVLDGMGYRPLRVALEAVEKITDSGKKAALLESLVTENLRKAIVESIVTNLARGHIPQAFNDRHKTEAEVEGPIREMERSLRENGLRLFILKNYGVNIEFRSNTWFDKVVSVFTRKPKTSPNPLLNPVIEEPEALTKTDRELVTMSKADRSRVFYINVSNIVHTWATEIIPNYINGKLKRPARIANKDVKSYQISELFNFLVGIQKLIPLGSLDNRTASGNNPRRATNDVSPDSDVVVEADSVDFSGQVKGGICGFIMGRLSGRVQ